MKRICIGLIAFVCVWTAFGQTTTTGGATTGGTAVNGAATVATPSTWFVGSGIELNPYSKVYSTPAYEPFVHVGGCWTSLCEITTMEFGATSATVRQDMGYKMKASADGSSMLIAIAGGSLTTTTAANSVIPASINLGGVGGGFAVKVDPGMLPLLKTIKGKGVSVLGEVRIAAVSSQGVQPQIAFSLNYRFK
jgi:hypothetical protein